MDFQWTAGWWWKMYKKPKMQAFSSLIVLCQPLDNPSLTLFQCITYLLKYILNEPQPSSASGVLVSCHRGICLPLTLVIVFRVFSRCGMRTCWPCTVLVQCLAQGCYDTNRTIPELDTDPVISGQHSVSWATANHNTVAYLRHYVKYWWSMRWEYQYKIR